MACALMLAAVQTHAQGVMLIEPPVQLLPQSFAGWQKTANAPAPPDTAPSLTTLSKQALQECGPLRSLVNGYARSGRGMRVEAVEFGDRTGAYSAFTLALRPEMRAAKNVGSSNATGDGAVIFTDWRHLGAGIAGD